MFIVSKNIMYTNKIEYRVIDSLPANFYDDENDETLPRFYMHDNCECVVVECDNVQQMIDYDNREGMFVQGITYEHIEQNDLTTD